MWFWWVEYNADPIVMQSNAKNSRNLIGCVLCLPRRDFARVRAFFSTWVALLSHKPTYRHVYIPKSIEVALAIGQTEQYRHLLE